MAAREKHRSKDRAPARPVPSDAHEWVSFEDPGEDRTWRFDVTFLLSRWTCIFGHGCQGVLTGPAPELEQGCCSYGAHFTDREDAARVRAASRALTREQWQFYREGHRSGVTCKDADGATVTRLVEDACIFLNRPGFPGGAGCALHRAAIETGRNPLELKPDVCWQLPLRREEDEAPSGHVTTTVTQWDRRHWGEGGEEFHWWCTEAPEAFTGSQPVYRSMGPELAEMVGAEVHGMLTAYLDARVGGSVPLPHPTVRTAKSNGRAKGGKSKGKGTH